MKTIYQNIVEKSLSGEKQLVVLIDPDKSEKLDEIIKRSNQSAVSYFFVGGSLLTTNQLENCIKKIKASTAIPVILFPGSILQVSNLADAILFLSLISGRNADLLIGKHVVSAPLLKSSKLEIMPTGYMLIDGGKPTTASYISNTTPIPADKDDIALCTAIAGEMLGLKLIYLDAGSGALNAVSETMINKIKKNVSVPVIVGGGIRTPEQAEKAFKSGADIVVVGNAIEKDPALIETIANKMHGVLK